MTDALEKARKERLERQAQGETEPLDEWPDGPPDGDDEAMERYNAALRQWHEEHIGPAGTDLTDKALLLTALRHKSRG